MCTFGAPTGGSAPGRALGLGLGPEVTGSESEKDVGGQSVDQESATNEKGTYGEPFENAHRLAGW